MSLRSLLTKLGNDEGIEIDPDELDHLGLSEKSDDEELESQSQSSERSVNFDDPLPGRAAGVLEIFLAEASTTNLAATEKDGLIWAPIARAGQWAIRPDGRGGKKRVPLKVIAGRSKDQRKEIGLQDVVDAFDDQAVEDVTVPESHDNKPTENHGYVEKLKMVKGKLRDGSTEDVLLGGYNIPDKKTRKKFVDGLVPNRSAGFLYDYTRTDTGKTYPVVLEHVALTPRAWLRGMPRFGRPVEALSDGDLPIASMVLSDEGPNDDEYVLILADAEQAEDFLAEPAVTWNQEDDPEWLQQQVNSILNAARAEKFKARRNTPAMFVEDIVPSYRCKSAKPGSALISDGWGDSANYWVAGLKIVDGAAELDEFTSWQATKKVYVPDSERVAPTGDKAPLADQAVETTDTADPLQLAQASRRRRAGQQDDTQNDTPRGGGNMADDTSKLQFSDEARAMIKAAEDRAAAAEQRAEKLSEKVDKLIGTEQSNTADRFVAMMKRPVADGGLGLSEDRGFGGMLNEVHALMLADDGEPAVQSEHFADDTNKEGTLSLSAALQRVFGALRTAEGSTLKLGDIVPAASEKREGEQDSGKPGRDASGDEVDYDKLSDDDAILAAYEKQYPGAVAAAGIKIKSSNSSNGSTGKTGE